MTKIATKAPVKTATKTTTKVPAKKGWRIKEYYVDPKAFAAASKELVSAPNQVRIMMKHFAEKFNDAGKASQGKIMCQSAIDNAGLKTVIDPAVLFAYYRARMEQYGLKLKDN